MPASLITNIQSPDPYFVKKLNQMLYLIYKLPGKIFPFQNNFINCFNYIHQNPIRAGLVEKAEDYLYSSGRIWRKNPLENEPLMVDIDKIEWREA